MYKFSFEFIEIQLVAKEHLEEDDKVEKLCDEFWEWRMKESPEFASYCGDQRYCDLLDDIDTEAFKGFEVSQWKILLWKHFSVLMPCLDFETFYATTVLVLICINY